MFEIGLSENRRRESGRDLQIFSNRNAKEKRKKKVQGTSAFNLQAHNRRVQTPANLAPGLTSNAKQVGHSFKTFKFNQQSKNSN